jgi:Ras-related protein Rab-5C
VAKHWVHKLKVESEKIIIALVGNKSDRVSPGSQSIQRAVQTDEVEAFDRSAHILFLETFAKTGHNVAKLFDALASRVCTEPQTSEPDTAMFLDISYYETTL